MTKQEVVDKLLPPARAIEAKYGIPSLFILSQIITESGWLKHGIGNNLAGIKAGKSWAGKKQLVRTTEFFADDKQGSRFAKVYSVTKTPSGRYKYVVDDWFRDYDSIEEFMEDHAQVLLKPWFSAARGEKDPKKFVEKLQSGKIKYATAPNYVQTIKAVIDTVKRYIK